MHPRMEFIAVHLDGLPRMKKVRHEIDHIVVLPGGVVVADRHVPVVPHPAEKYVFPACEPTGKSRASVVPLARAVAVVSVPAEDLCKGDVALRDVSSLRFQMKQGTAGIEHGPAGHTDRSVGTAGDMGLFKHSTVFCQPIQVRSMNLRISQGVNRIVALVVRQDKNHVLFHRFPFLSRNR